jgi:hypothetical protein
MGWMGWMDGWMDGWDWTRVALYREWVIGAGNSQEPETQPRAASWLGTIYIYMYSVNCSHTCCLTNRSTSIITLSITAAFRYGKQGRSSRHPRRNPRVGRAAVQPGPWQPRRPPWHRCCGLAPASSFVASSTSRLLQTGSPVLPDPSSSSSAGVSLDLADSSFVSALAFPRVRQCPCLD